MDKNIFNHIKLFIYKHRKSLNTLTIVALFVCLTIPAYADVGNFSHSASSSSGGYSSHSGSSSSGGLDGAFFIYLLFNHPVFAIILIALYIIANRRKSSDDGYDGYDTSNTSSSSISSGNNCEDIAIQKIQDSDAYFDVNKFKSRTSNMFMNLQQAWMKKDWRIVRPYESDSLFSVHNAQLQEYINKNQTNMMENICVKRVMIKNFYSNPKTMIDSIEVIIEASFIDYVKDDMTGKILSGNSTKPIFMRYKWTLIRKSGVKSKLDNNGIQSTSCPNCGAPVSIGASGECEYCHSIVTSGDYDWVLSSIEV